MNTAKHASRKQIMLAAEFGSLFIALPFFLFLQQDHLNPIPILLLIASATTIYLLSKQTFPRIRFYNIAGFKIYSLVIIKHFFSIALVLALGLYVIAPDIFLYCPKEKVSVWATIMLTYPLLSVYPQEIIYRGFLLERYKPIFQSKRHQLHASALAFSFGHIIYGNTIALVLTLIGGYLFTSTYMRSKSLLLTAMEHALYGCFIFTIGLGRFLFSGFESLG